MKQVSDDGAILAIVNSVLDANPQSIEDFKNGKDRLCWILSRPGHEGESWSGKS